MGGKKLRVFQALLRLNQLLALKPLTIHTCKLTDEQATALRRR